MEAIQVNPRALTAGRVPRAMHGLRVVQPISRAVREEMELSAEIFADAVRELEARAQEQREADLFALSMANLCM
jgi:hypothetical protein